MNDQFAIFCTTAGDFVCRLFHEAAPRTVENFVGLATGTREWTDPRTGMRSRYPLYNGTVFHRVIPDFMIQGGDPLGKGIGGPGYRIEDEFRSGLGFDRPGILGMANAGPNTGGSQFFVTEIATDWLNNKHTVFGDVVAGFPVIPVITRSGNGKVVLNAVIISSDIPTALAPPRCLRKESSERARNYSGGSRNFPADVIDYAMEKQGGKCACPGCSRRLSRIDWQAHHKNGDSTDNSRRNCALVCRECHLYCFHQGAWQNPPVSPRVCRR